MMRYRQLGRTDLQVSEIGFGTWGIGGTAQGAISYGPTNDRESCDALRRAFDLGVTFYDTADLYGHGHSEEILGAAFKAVRANVVIASKAGLVGRGGAQDFSPRHLRAALEASLRRLQTDYLDLYQLHDPDLNLVERDERILGELRAFQEEGKIRAYGISVRNPDDGLRAVQRLGVPCLQVNFNMTDQRAHENNLMNLCRQDGVGIVCRTPLCFGFLTGKYAAQGQFEPGDHRSRWTAEQRTAWASAPQLFSSIVVDHHGETAAQLALRFCLSYPAVSTVIPGMLTVAHVDENILASQLGPLSESERLGIEQMYHAHQFWVSSEAPLKEHARSGVREH